MLPEQSLAESKAHEIRSSSYQLPKRIQPRVPVPPVFLAIYISTSTSGCLTACMVARATFMCWTHYHLVDIFPFTVSAVIHQRWASSEVNVLYIYHLQGGMEA
jgi:hypothetical protein